MRSNVKCLQLWLRTWYSTFGINISLLCFQIFLLVYYRLRPKFEDWQEYFFQWTYMCTYCELNLKLVSNMCYILEVRKGQSCLPPVYFICLYAFSDPSHLLSVCICCMGTLKWRLRFLIMWSKMNLLEWIYFYYF